ncbi:GNAT family N-acetyltransferase [Sneathiella marina]|uniref:GNAT family N-acetyltransferase n=1 Tax=Sneathiella marina TaxID=2950108 RepID=A0ABY4WCM9_9PROT|nr:GNAT family N-acetyltransferase [Sneathiella marina]USG63004.1 GNAT family N-acetyltransferase [Sneathiella marina]
MQNALTPDILPAKPGDGAELSILALESKAYWGYSDEFIKSCETALKITDEMIGRLHSGTVKEDSSYVGFYFLSEEGTHAELQLLYISPVAIGKGYGRALFKSAMKKASSLGYTEMRIEADPNAVDFYKRMGAKHTGWCRSEVDDTRELPLLMMPL